MRNIPHKSGLSAPSPFSTGDWIRWAVQVPGYKAPASSERDWLYSNQAA